MSSRTRPLLAESIIEMTIRRMSNLGIKYDVKQML